MWYRRENGVIVGGPYNCDQQFPVDELPDDHPEVVAFTRKPIPDRQAVLAAAIDGANNLSELKAAVKQALGL